MDDGSQCSREKGVQGILQHYTQQTDPAPLILIGDLNVAEDNPVIAYLSGRSQSLGETPAPLVDSFRALYPDATRVGTYNGFAGKRSGAKIDYIFASPELQVRAAAIVRTEREGRYPSDHFPVTARLSYTASAELNKPDGK